MNNIQEIRDAMIKNAMHNGHNKDFDHNLQLLRIFFKLGVIGQQPRWYHSANAFVSAKATPVNPSSTGEL